MIRLLCIEYRDIFPNILSSQPASIPPFDLVVQDPKWRVSKNRQPPTPQSAANQKEITKQLNILTDQGIIEKCTAAYHSQGFLVTKADRSKRCVIDYRNLNKCTGHTSWPVPNITGMLQRIGSQKPTIFGTVDFAQADHQAALTLATIKYTLFILYSGIYQFTRLPFGLKQAPSYFQ